MPYLYLILSIVALILLFIIFKTVLKAFFKIFLYAFLILFVATGVFGYLIYRDAMDFKEKFTVSDNLFLLVDNGRIISGFVMHKAGEPGALTTEQLDVIRSEYNGGKFTGNLAQYYKTVVIKTEVFNASGSVDYSGQKIEKRLMLEVLRSDNPVDTYLDARQRELGLIQIDREATKSAIGISDEELKLSFFVLLYADDLGVNPLKIILQYKKGNIAIYPETVMFKTIRYLPLNLVETAGLLNNKIYKQNITGMMAWLGRL